MAQISVDFRERFKNLSIKGIKPLNKQLGSGAYGRVYKVTNGKVEYAAKEIHPILAQTGSWHIKKFEQECVHCSELTHPNIVSCVGLYYPSPEAIPAIVMELMDESLTKYVEKPNISLNRKISILHDVAEGLNYLHTRISPVIHRDLSPNNILLKRPGDALFPPVAKIGDLGVAKALDLDVTSAMRHLTQAPGTTHFMPPEAFLDNPKYDTSLDIFSYGGIMLHTVNQQWPKPKPPTEFDPVTRQTKGLSEVERRKEYIDQLTGEAEVLRPLVEACLDNDPAMRPSISHLSEKIKPLKESSPLVPALQSGCYAITWERCADLPFPMYNISAVQHDKKVYIMAGRTPDDDRYLYQVCCYNVDTDQWGQLPSPDHHCGRLQIIDGKLNAISGVDNITRKYTNKVSTYIDSTWTSHFPNLLRARYKPGVVSHSEYVIVAGGMRDRDTINDDIEVLNIMHPSQWMMTSILLPEPMWGIFPIISDNMMYIVGYSTSTGRSCRAYKLPVDVIVSSTTQQATSDHPVQWLELPSAPHYHTIMTQHSPTSDHGWC